ncbi:MAG: 5'-methylthioadenosine/adenosylhomocysteine nucleosidase [Spirochaeta sp.]
MILVAGAMQQEIASVKAALAQGWNPGTRVQAEVIGVGKVMAAMNTQRLIDKLQPQAVLMVGVAGGLNPELTIGDVIAADQSIQHDLDVTELGMPRGQVPFTKYRWYQADKALLNAAMQVQPEGTNHAGQPIRVVSGRVLTGDTFMSRAAQQQNRYMRNELHGDAVDMESAAVAQVCVSNMVPHVIVRVISDTADGSAKIDFQRFLPSAGDRIFSMVDGIVRRCSL